MKVRRWCSSFYHFCVVFPDHFYPFSEIVEGKRVRFKAAYDQALARMQEDYGYGHYGPKLIAYRSLFHVLGSLLFISFATLISKDLFGSDTALYVLFVLASAFLLFSEFYVQPRTLGQRRGHSLFDWLSWVVPFGVYLFIHLH